MKTDIEIYREGQVIAGHGDYRLIVLNGQVYPFRGKNMLNPLDPFQLLNSICNEGSNDANPGTVYWARKILNTVLEASRIRDCGYSVVTKYKSGSPKAILESATDNVIILGELCKRKDLLLPVMSVQLADGDYRQENIPVWRKRNLHRPCRYDCKYSKNTWENDGSTPDHTWTRRTIETWSLWGDKFSIIREEAYTENADSVEHEYFRKEVREDED